MAWIGVAASVAGSLLSSSMQSDAAQSAGQTQANASTQAANLQKQMFDTVNQQQAPYRQGGYTALDAILRGSGLPVTGAGAQYSGGATGARGASTGYVPVGGVGSNASGGATYTDNRTLFGTDDMGNPIYLNGSAPPTVNVTAAANTQPFDVGGTQYRQGGSTGFQANINGQWTDLNPATTDFAQLQKSSGSGGAQSADSAAGDQTGIATGFFTHQFNANDLNDNLAPNYAFVRDQGLGAIKNAGNLQTGLISGNTLKGINDYAMNYAGNAYQQAYNNFTNNQSNIFNRLSSIAGLGQTAVGQTGNSAVQSGQNIGNSIQAAGAAQAAGQVGAANATAGGINNAIGWYTLSNILKSDKEP